MDDPRVVIPDHAVEDDAPPHFPDAAPIVCLCPTPLPDVVAHRKGAARTYCARCGLPVRIDFAL
jgi:hypothetical protein